MEKRTFYCSGRAGGNATSQGQSQNHGGTLWHSLLLVWGRQGGLNSHQSICDGAVTPSLSCRNLRTGQLLRRIPLGQPDPASVCHKAFSDAVGLCGAAWAVGGGEAGTAWARGSEGKVTPW